MSILSVQKVSEDVKVPVYDKVNQYILFASEDKHLLPNRVTPIPVGVRIAFPKNYCALLIEGFNLYAVGGLVDSDFRGEIRALVHSPVEVFVKKGDPVARMVMIEIALPEIVTEDYLKDSETDEENTLSNDD
ncbi:uncharacterized protein VICG_01105 [Vittaforma corneae ATCC 50505]|uniref:dUTPase-like domain-containing protein n=1 Tax=Vittaforma corneae (strain ATCC 50505) TaxID=993615 RepID=L2GM53_VITCO|nr:uncharacterized protein VICG_01105 [Vittaforma corneae ATCC 50505]ELA41921.1 hypothetical protein VICG_01105 [Vittaforma corneae ATCC 50505]